MNYIWTRLKDGVPSACTFPSSTTVQRILAFYKRIHFAGGVLTPPLTKGDARPAWKPHNVASPQEPGINK